MTLEEHAQHLPRKLSRRLTISEDLAGKLDLDAFQFAEECNEHFKGSDIYAGVTLFGSRTKGYAESDSDIDVVVFIDGRDNSLAGHAKRNLLNLAVEAFVNQSRYRGRIHLNFVYLPKKLRSADDLFPHIFGPNVIGPHFEEFRALYARQFKRMLHRSQEKLLEDMAEKMAVGERESWWKLPDRLAAQAPGHGALSQIGNARKALWKEQFRQALTSYAS